MTRAQIEAARERVDNVLSGYPTLDDLDEARWDELLRRVVTAVLGHPDGRAPKAAPTKQPGRGTRLRFAR